MINAYCGQAAKFAFDPLSLLLSVNIYRSAPDMFPLGSPHVEFLAIRVQSSSLLVSHVVICKALAEFDKKVVASRLSTVQNLSKRFCQSPRPMFSATKASSLGTQLTSASHTR